MPVSLTSPDGSQTVRQITVRGRTYDVPPWVDESEFIAGIGSGNMDDPFAALVRCELIGWEDLERSNGQRSKAAFFEAEWFIPWDGRQELVVNAFTPLTGSHGGEGGYGKDVFKMEMGPSGVHIWFKVFEYVDFNDVQAFLLPKDLGRIKAIQKAKPNKYVDEALYDLFHEHKGDFDAFVKNETGWDSLAENVSGPNGEPYLLFLHVHED